jgi:ribosomal protein L16 Arg81 hydroxylase
MKTLQHLIFPQQVSEFFEQYWSRQFLYIAGNSEKFQNIFSIKAFEDLIHSYGALLNYPRVTVYSAAGLVHDSRFTFGSDIRISGALGYTEESRVDFSRLQQLLSNGATMKISEIDAFSASITRLVTSISAELREKVHVNLYYSAPQSRAFADHFDKHDVFVLQTDGSKRWEVFEYQERFPLPGMKKSRDTQYRKAPKHEFLVNPGDFLYIPRGMWHNAFTAESHSLHLTVGIQCATGIDLMRWVVERLVATERLRNNLVHSNDTLNKSFKAELNQAFSSQLDDPCLLKSFYDQWASTKQPKLDFTLAAKEPGPARRDVGSNQHDPLQSA